MTSIGMTGCPVGSIKAIDTSQMKLFRPSEEEHKAWLVEQANGLIEQHRKPLAPLDTVYAIVQVNGKAVGTFYNGGSVGLPSAMAGRFDRDAFADMPGGPNLAQARAEHFAKAVGGKVVKASTAQTQAQWETRPPVQWKIDYAAIEHEIRSQQRGGFLNTALLEILHAHQDSSSIGSMPNTWHK